MAFTACESTSAELGRHIVRLDVLAGVPAAVLTTDLAFDRLGVRRLRSSVVSTNRPVLSLHKKSGFKRVGILHTAQTIGGRLVDLVQFLLKVEDWARVRKQLLPLAQLAGNRVREWEQSPRAAAKPWVAPAPAFYPMITLLPSRVLRLILNDGFSFEDVGNWAILGCGDLCCLMSQVRNVLSCLNLSWA